MVRGRWFGVAVAVGLVAVVLTGCSSPAPLKTPAPKAVPSATATPVAQDADTAPSTRFYTTCASLLDPSQVGDGLTLLPSSPATWPAGVAAEQAALLDCTWTDGTSVGAGTSTSPIVSVSAVPDAAAAAQNEIAGALAKDATASDLGLGEASAGSCVLQPLYCTASVLQNGAWIRIELGGDLSHVPTSSQAAALASLKTISAGVIAQLGQAGPAWKAPASTWSPAPACSTLTADPSAALGVGTGSWRDWNRPGDEDLVRMYAGYDTGWLSNCAWQDPKASPTTAVALQIVADGAWVWDRVTTATGVTSEPLTVAGADKAAYLCTSSGYCNADAIADHTWFEVTFMSTDVADATQKLAAVLASVIASKA